MTTNPPQVTIVINTPSELGAGNAVETLVAPRDGFVKVYARFASERDAAPPSSAILSGSINGAPIGPKSDYNFDHCDLVLDPPPIAVMAGATITFNTHRENRQARQTRWEMTLTFT